VRAIDLVLHSGAPGEIYNIAANNRPEIRNRDWAHWLMGRLHPKAPVLEHQPDPRPDHDFRYGVDAAKIQALGWAPSPNVWTAFERTVRWYESNEQWWKPLVATSEAIYAPRNVPQILATGDDNVGLVRRLLLEKLSAQSISPDDLDSVLDHRSPAFQQAIKYFEQHGDFHVSWIPGDGDGYGEKANSLGGQVLGQLLVYKP
jgi:hypothetical protein